MKISIEATGKQRRLRFRRTVSLSLELLHFGVRDFANGTARIEDGQESAWRDGQGRYGDPDLQKDVRLVVALLRLACLAQIKVGTFRVEKPQCQ